MTAAERGDLAESLVPVAAELAFLVRDEDREAIGAWMDERRIATEDADARALLVVLAAMVSVDATEEDMLAWVTWDEHGEPLDGTIPLLPRPPAAEPEPLRPDCRLAEYTALRSRGLTQKEAAARMGVHRRTTSRYDAKLRDEGLTTWPVRGAQTAREAADAAA